MKVAVVGVDKNIVERELRSNGFVIDKLKPDMVLSFGGDGSALFAEQMYPGVPRLTIKHSKICEKCTIGGAHDFSKIFDKLKRKEYKVVDALKVEGIVGNDNTKRLVGLNEINIAHAFPIKAIRFDVDLDSESVASNLIGDGVLVSTPYGSTAYFKSITGRSFSEGIGIAFNNVNQRIKYRLAKDSSKVKIVLKRGPALMCADNNTTMVPLKKGDVVTVKKSKETAKLIELKGEENKLGV